MNKTKALAKAEASAFLVTKEYRRFAEFCEACRRDRYIGLCYGPPGVGKTLSARPYAPWATCEAHEFEYFHPADSRLASCRTLYYTPTVSNTPRSIATEVDGLHFRFNCLVAQACQELGQESDVDRDCCELLLGEEAERLKMQSLAQVRDAYDRGHFGLIFIGMPGLEKRLSRYPQLYSRVGFAHAFRALSAEEMQFIPVHHGERWGFTLERTDFSDREAVAAVVRITGGNFRLIHRLFGQIERILQINGFRSITKEIVEAARECLVIGTI
jgi:DNA transposition AAA+ family ATPase